jgi:hypothetical protein
VFGYPMVEQISKKALALALAAGLFAATVIAVTALSAGAAGGGGNKKAQLIGPTKEVAKPTCPSPKKDKYPAYKACNAFGHVTGFQLRTNGQRAVHKIRKDGWIVAWGLDLGDPGKGSTARDFFEAELKDNTFGRYGSEPVANISILKRKDDSKRKDRYTLSKQSPIVKLDEHLGSKPIFTLDKPLKVRKGRIVGLSTPTWVTNFALQAPGKKAGLSGKNKWIASREPDRCEGEDLNKDGVIQGSDEIRNLTKRSKPQYKKGSTRTYGCVYGNAQILYWAYFVPAGGKKGDGKN